MDFSPDKMRARFHELRKDLEARQAKLDPIRAERDALVAASSEPIDKLGKKIKAAQEQMVDIEMEMAALARALGGKTSEPVTE